MDFSRAKTIFIVVFAALNIFLFYFLGLYRNGSSVSKEVLENTVLILERGGITLDCDIPLSNRSMKNLLLSKDESCLYNVALKLLNDDSVKADTIRNKSITRGSKTIGIYGNTLRYQNLAPEEYLPVLDQKEIEKYAEKLLKDIGINISHYKLDSYAKKSDGTIRIKYIEAYKGYLVFGNIIDMVIGSKGLTSLEYSSKKIKGLSAGSSVTVMQAYQVLLKNQANLAYAGPAVIKGLDIGYGMPEEVNDEMEEYSEGLYWRVVLESGAEKYFEAQNGEMVR